MQVKVYVISLKHARERRANIEPQLASLGIEYEIFDAIEDGDGFAHFEGYDEETFLWKTGRKASAGEAACFASHRMLWQRAVSMNESLVVLEDDSELESIFPAALSESDQLIDEFGFIRFQDDFARRHKKRWPVRKAGRFVVNYYASYPFGAMGYAISPDVARRFVDLSWILAAPVDTFIKRYWEHGKPLYGLYPFPVRWGDLAYRTMIGVRTVESGNLSLQVARSATKFRDWFRRRSFNQAHWPPARRYPHSAET